MSPLRTRIDVTGPDARLFSAVIAGLPSRYQLSAQRPDVVVTSGDDDAATIAACAEASRAVVVDRPGQLSVQALHESTLAAAQTGCRVVPAARYAPALDGYGATPPIQRETVRLVECSISTTSHLPAALVEQLALIRAVVGEIASVQVVRSAKSHYVTTATVAGRSAIHLILSGIASPIDVDGVELNVVGPQARLAASIPGGRSARPATITRYDDRGAHSPPPRHQHPHRTTLIRLHRGLTSGRDDVRYHLADLDHDVRLAAALTAGSR